MVVSRAKTMSTCSIWFTPRIWFDEVERIGMKRCTPAGYALNGLGGLFWFCGILMIPGMPVYLGYTVVVGTFFWSLLWLLAAPLVVILLGSVLIGVSWSLACRKKFYFDYERRESSWTKGAEKRSYTLCDWQAGSR
jgi:hypothetical protein